MACVQLNHDIPHRNRFHPGNYILHNCWNRGHRRSHSDRNLFYCQFYETITFLTTLPVGELLSSSEHNHYYLWNRHHGNIDIDGRYFQYQLYHLLVAASIPGHELYFISVYLGQHNGLIHANLHVQVAEYDLYKVLNRSYKQNFQQHRHDSHHINDQDFVSDFTLPSNKAYPWGGNGPLFRRPNTTATDSENVAVRQPGLTFSFGRTQSSTEPLTEDNGSIDEEPTETDAADEKSAAAITTRKGAKKVEDEKREWVIVPSNPEDEPEEHAEPRGIFVSYGIGSPCGCSVKGEFRHRFSKSLQNFRPQY
ncbi:hypothetical protein K4K60_008288 [Colletotrichum sp. SAR11_57]|nr:hypothetical protein K4K60_008288 [Colletotrichum sp. SAR11_57]